MKAYYVVGSNIVELTENINLFIRSNGLKRSEFISFNTYSSEGHHYAIIIVEFDFSNLTK